MSYKITRGIREGHLGGLGGFWGGLRGGLGGWVVLGGCRGGQEGSAGPLKGTFCPSGSLIQDQIWFQTPHNGATSQYLQDQYHWPVFGPFGALSGAPKGQFHCQTSHFEAPNSPQSGLLSPEMIISWPIIPEWIILDYIWSIYSIWWPFQGAKGQIGDYLGPQNGLFGNEITLWGPLVVPRQAQKWVIDTDLVNIGQLDHYVVFWTKFVLYKTSRGAKSAL